MSTKNQRGGAKASPKTERPAEAVVEPIENVEIEWLILANWAETINGMLYIQGGGWDRILAPPKGQPINFGNYIQSALPALSRQGAYCKTRLAQD